MMVGVAHALHFKICWKNIDVFIFAKPVDFFYLNATSRWGPISVVVAG